MSRAKRIPAVLAGVLAVILFAAGFAVATSLNSSADDSNSPYIEQLQKSLPPVESSEGYVESIKGKLAPEDSAGYTEKLKESPEVNSGATSSEGYTDQVKQTLAPKPEGGAIEAVKEGHSELKLRKSLDIHAAFGLRVGMGLTRNVTAPQIGGANFNSIYGNSFSPDISLYYEYQFLRSEKWGSFGAFGMGGIAYFTGMGAFAIPINFAGSNSPVTQSRTGLRYFEIPTVGGLSWRMNLFKYVRPYVMAGPSLIGGSETRNDGNPAHYALSEGFWGAGGISILMDWISRSEDWTRYDDYTFKHTYFTIEYSKLATLQSSPVIYSEAGVYAGFAFEF